MTLDWETIWEQFDNWHETEGQILSLSDIRAPIERFVEAQIQQQIREIKRDLRLREEG